jgi:HAD superfamily hydrolase (TIGR01509 family)
MARMTTSYDNGSNSFGVLWDMDGVLVDTGQLHYETWAEALGRAGVEYSHEMFHRTFGMENRGVLTTVLGREPDDAFLAEVSGRKESRFRDLIRGQAAPMAGVVDWLQRLKAQGVLQAVASSAPLANIDLLIDSLGLRQYFDAVVSAAGMAGKPDPAVFLKAAGLIDVPPARCVVVEDAVVGVQAARSAGMHVIAVTTTHPRAALEAADRVVSSLLELPENAFEALARPAASVA